MGEDKVEAINYIKLMKHLNDVDEEQKWQRKDDNCKWWTFDVLS